MRWCDSSQAVFSATKWHAHVERWHEVAWRFSCRVYDTAVWINLAGRRLRCFPNFPQHFQIYSTLSFSLSLSRRQSLSTQEALSPVLGRGEDTAGPHQHGDTGGLCDGQLRVWNRSHLIAWKRWPPTASKQTESLSPVAWPTSRWKIPLGCSKAHHFMGRSWFILVVQLGT